MVPEAGKGFSFYNFLVRTKTAGLFQVLKLFITGFPDNLFSKKFLKIFVHIQNFVCMWISYINYLFKTIEYG
ncbi:MAG: hypothetical protein BWY45_02458 [Euryarchaeota archaeon ADurb.Bin294]|nr:MAG: hypothetical protein BWY45_02458 [Euryarchaeota archaeon ADurb.Bin294]